MDQQLTEQAEQTSEQVAQESEAAFTSGFNEARGIEAPEKAPEPDVKEAPPKEEVKEEPKEEPAQEETPPAKPEWAEQLEKFGSRIRNIEGHIGGLASQLKGVLAASKAVEKTGVESPTANQVEQAAADSKRWQAIREDYPEWAEAMDERLAAERAAMKAPTVDLDGLKREVGQSVTTVEQSLRGENRELREEIVEMRHPEWKKTVQSPEFTGWFKKQPADIQNLASSVRPSDAIRLLDSYKQASKVAKQEKEQRLRSAVTPKGTPASPHTLNDDDAFEKGFARARGS